MIVKKEIRREWKTPNSSVSDIENYFQIWTVKSI